MTKLTELLIHQLLYFREKTPLSSVIGKLPGGPKVSPAPLVAGIQRAGVVTPKQGVRWLLSLLTRRSVRVESHLSSRITPQTTFLHHAGWEVISNLGQNMKITETTSSVTTGTRRMSRHVECLGATGLGRLCLREQRLGELFSSIRFVFTGQAHWLVLRLSIKVARSFKELLIP